MSRVSWLVGRLHVSLSDREVLHEIRGRLKPGTPRETRRAMYREALKCHHENREMYRSVMRGGR